MGKRDVEIARDNIEMAESREDLMQEQEYISDNIQLLHKKIEPHNTENFKIISRNLQLGNFSEGGHMYQMILLSYERSITYTLTQKQKIKKDYDDSYYILPDDKILEFSKINPKDHEARKNYLEKHRVLVTKTIKHKPYFVTNIYKNTKTGETFEQEDEIEELPFISEHIRDSPLERSSFHSVSSNSVGGFLRKNERTISREINSVNRDIEAEKPILMKNDKNGYNSGGGYP